MTDSKITALSALSPPTLDALLAIVAAPGSSPVTNKIALQDLFTNANWVLPQQLVYAPSSDFTLGASSGVQTAFGVALTVLAATTYMFGGQYILNTGATTHTTALAFALATATVASFEYTVDMWSAALNTLTTTQSTVHVSGVASKVLNATGTAVYTIITFQGIARFTLGGTITPQVNFSANPTGTNLMKEGSYIWFTPIGSSSFVSSGAWA